MTNLLKKERGFTLIEIVLVLAIAGLLLVIVFLAVSGAQRSRRDSQRKNDAARVLSAVESCAGNNQGAYTNCLTTAQIIGPYMTAATAVDPLGTNYALQAGAPTVAGQIQVRSGNSCAGAAGARVVSVRIFQEQGAAGFCVDNL